MDDDAILKLLRACPDAEDAAFEVLLERVGAMDSDQIADLHTYCQQAPDVPRVLRDLVARFYAWDTGVGDEWERTRAEAFDQRLAERLGWTGSQQSVQGRVWKVFPADGQVIWSSYTEAEPEQGRPPRWRLPGLTRWTLRPNSRIAFDAHPPVGLDEAPTTALPIAAASSTPALSEVVLYGFAVGGQRYVLGRDDDGYWVSEVEHDV